MASQFLPILITFGLAFATAVALLGLSALLGHRSRQNPPAKTDAYESGVPLLDHAQKRISVRFYIVALVFVVLNVQVAFLYPWAITFRELSAIAPWVVLLDIVAFVFLLVLIYAWLWRDGTFDWGPRKKKLEDGVG